ncbi:MAG TPA: HAMP domain-containing histidine kinase [Dehalococcoidia bacterium]|nr:HAMP domain-containing histidine kinase [Dehalococcoidia bacterium]
METLNDSPITTEAEHERSPQEAALRIWLKVLITTRWTAIPVVIIASLVATRVFNIAFPTAPVYYICVFIALYNLALLLQARRIEARGAGSLVRTIRFYGSIHIVLDLVTLTVLLHFTGGIENPFIFYFVLHIIGASIALSRKEVYLLASTALFMVSLLVGLEYAGVLPHVNLVGFAPPLLYQQVSHILAVLVVLATALYISTYMATSVAMELRRRQQEVIELRERLLHERTGQLEKASIEIAKLEEEKQRFLHFLGIAAHDLKAPLTAIQGFLWIMLGGYSGELSDKQKNMLERSSRRITELLNLISDLLDIPRIETGQTMQDIKEISLREVVRRSLDDLRNTAKEKGIKLKVEIPQNLPRIQGSSPRLQQVITNLVSNAISYTPEGTVTIRITEKAKELQVEVIDTGIGIPPDELPQVFDDFFRASNVEARGTGLGLSISRRIVEAHGGRIWVESPYPENNRGSKFTCTLPKKNKGKKK